MISIREAFSILQNLQPLGVECRPIGETLGYALAEAVVADRDIPPTHRSAMDGYAMKVPDLQTAPFYLRLAGEVPAGTAEKAAVEPGTCVRIMTGAGIPPGADTVAILEVAREEGKKILFSTLPKPGANIIRRAEDASAGEILLKPRTLLGPLQVGVCASVGKTEVTVYRRPGVALLCTGEELRDPGDPVEAHQIRNSNGPAIGAALASLGYTVRTNAIVRDTLESLISALHTALKRAEVVLLTGGVSRGKYDLVRESVEKIGGAIQFHGVAMKPGKPLLYATLGNNADLRHIFGLPGNPLGALTGFYEFVLPALRRLSGVDPEECRPSMFIPLGEKISTKGGRTHFILGKLEWGKTGPKVIPQPSKSSADLVAGGRSDGVIVLSPDDPCVEAGATVEFRTWKPLL